MASSLAGRLGFMVWVVGGSSPQNSLVRTKRLHTNDSPPKKPLHSSTCCWDAWNTLKIAHEWSTHSSSQVLAHLCFLFWGEVIYNIEPLGPNAPISDVVEMIVWLWGQNNYCHDLDLFTTTAESMSHLRLQLFANLLSVLALDHWGNLRRFFRTINQSDSSTILQAFAQVRSRRLLMSR